MAIRLIFGEQDIFLSEESLKFKMTLELLFIPYKIYESANELEFIEIDRQLKSMILEEIDKKMILLLKENEYTFEPSINSDTLIEYNGLKHLINLRSETGGIIKFLLKLTSFFNRELIDDVNWITMMKVREITGSTL